MSGPRITPPSSWWTELQIVGIATAVIAWYFNVEGTRNVVILFLSLLALSRGGARYFIWRRGRQDRGRDQAKIAAFLAEAKRNRKAEH